MAEPGVYRLITQLIRPPNSTQGQITASMDINPLLDLVTDCLRFVTEFFEVISQSAPHIYHSALQLVPQSSTVQNLYSQYIGPPMARVVTGTPSSWDSCTASAGDIDGRSTVWSPCGNSIAVGSIGMVTICNSTTLERLSILKPPDHHVVIQSLAFSPDGRFLACVYMGYVR